MGVVPPQGFVGDDIGLRAGFEEVASCILAVLVLTAPGRTTLAHSHTSSHTFSQPLTVPPPTQELESLAAGVASA